MCAYVQIWKGQGTIKLPSRERGDTALNGEGGVNEPDEREKGEQGLREKDRGRGKK